MFDIHDLNSRVKRWFQPAPPEKQAQKAGKLNIAVMTRSPHCYSSRRLIEACEQRGHSVIAVDPLRCSLHMSQNKPAIYYKGEPLPLVDAVIPRIGASVTFYGLAVLRQFEMMGAYAINESNGIMRTRDKLRAHQLMSRHSIGMPDTWFVSDLKDLNAVLDNMGEGPYITKLLQGTHGKGVLKLDSKKNATATIEALMGLNANLMVQEFIGEAKGADLRVFVIGGKVVASMMRTAKEGEFRSNLHLGGSASIIELSDEEKATAIKAASIMGLNVAGVDMMRSKRGPMVLEVNSSPGLEGIEGITQKDLATAIVKFAERNAHSRGTIVTGRG